ncbi:MAG: peptidylprolyl isomerase, partial [Candidatus Aenigmarchaeota archaeon]|nr:peptidylprolyl isomerase [Candidatus Aenigmarchaeota archaeon]
MEKGDEKEITLKPADAYGDPNPQLIQKVPKDKLPEGADLKAGMQLAMALPNGQQIPATITEIGDTEVTIDINHPLAGKTLKFKVKVVNVS